MLQLIFRRMVVQNGSAECFVQYGTAVGQGKALDRLASFHNPSLPEDCLASYSAMTCLLDGTSIHAGRWGFDSDQDVAVGSTRTFDFGCVSFQVYREQGSQKYKEFTITFS